MAISMSNDDPHADLASHDSFVKGVPHATFRRLRLEDPLSWTDEGDGRGFWSLTRHQDIRAFNRRYELLSSARGVRIEDQSYEEYMARRTFQETDPPQHTHVRRKVSRAFLPDAIAKFEASVRALAIEILDRAIALKEFDAVAEIARQLPMRMLGKVLGTPDEDSNWLVDKGDQLIANSDPDYTDTVVDLVDTHAYRLMPFRSPAAMELFDYAKERFLDRADTAAGNGIIETILQPNEDGNTLSDEEFRNFFCLLVAAGNDTTRYSIASSFHALANQPQVFRQLQEASDEIWDTATDELIRWASPTLHFRRTATRDFTHHNQCVKRGDRVVLWFVSGNRDEQVFKDPFRIDLRRKPNPHIAFGQGGPHVCLGQWLARLELKTILQELVKRVARIEQTAPHRYLRSNFIGGIKHLPMRMVSR